MRSSFDGEFSSSFIGDALKLPDLLPFGERIPLETLPSEGTLFLESDDILLGLLELLSASLRKSLFSNMSAIVSIGTNGVPTVDTVGLITCRIGTSAIGPMHSDASKAVDVESTAPESSLFILVLSSSDSELQTIQCV